MTGSATPPPLCDQLRPGQLLDGRDGARGADEDGEGAKCGIKANAIAPLALTALTEGIFGGRYGRVRRRVGRADGHPPGVRAMHDDPGGSLRGRWPLRPRGDRRHRGGCQPTSGRGPRTSSGTSTRSAPRRRTCFRRARPRRSRSCARWCDALRATTSSGTVSRTAKVTRDSRRRSRSTPEGRGSSGADTDGFARAPCPPRARMPRLGPSRRAERPRRRSRSPAA
jgi:hypothetical protein